MRREGSWANHEMRDCGSSGTWSRCWSCYPLQSWFTSPPSSPFLLLFFLLERERVWGKWGESEWSWGSGVGKYLQFMLTYGPCPLMDKSSFPTPSTVHVFFSNGPVYVSNRLVDSGFAYPNLRTWSLWPWVHVEACNDFAHYFGEHKCLELGSSIGVLPWRLLGWLSWPVVNLHIVR
jgi:hypothetical protein